MKKWHEQTIKNFEYLYFFFKIYFKYGDLWLGIAIDWTIIDKVFIDYFKKNFGNWKKIFENWKKILDKEKNF